MFIREDFLYYNPIRLTYIVKRMMTIESDKCLEEGDHPDLLWEDLTHFFRQRFDEDIQGMSLNDIKRSLLKTKCSNPNFKVIDKLVGLIQLFLETGEYRDYIEEGQNLNGNASDLSSKGELFNKVNLFIDTIGREVSNDFYITPNMNGFAMYWEVKKLATSLGIDALDELANMIHIVTSSEGFRDYTARMSNSVGVNGTPLEE